MLKIGASIVHRTPDSCGRLLNAGIAGSQIIRCTRMTPSNEYNHCSTVRSSSVVSMIQIAPRTLIIAGYTINLVSGIFIIITERRGLPPAVNQIQTV
ncbi:hypothetical protein NT6N_24570 [Oceaniferula spumae]|uniref:Uncharacterized protein n=1 Tax=Oceaniferula spumae TaxID=2979115 RepID=A0AAT9FMR5_9BACT